LTTGNVLTKVNDSVEVESGLCLLLKGLLREAINPMGRKWLLSITDQAIVSMAGFLASIIIGRACGKEELGLYVLGMTIVSLMVEVQNAIIWSPYTVFSPRLSGSAHALYTGSTFVHQWTLAALGLLVIAGFGGPLSRRLGPRGLETVIWFLAISGSFLLFKEYVRRLCFAALRMKAVLLVDFGVTTVQTTALLILAYGGKLSASGALGIMGMACGLAGLSWLLWNWRAFKFSWAQVPADLKRNWSFGKWVLADALAFFMSCELYPWILSAFHGAAAVGVLAACQRIGTPMGPFLQGCLNFLPARTAHAFAHGGRDELRALVVKSTIVITAVVSPFCALLIGFGDWLVAFLYGPLYAGNSLLIAILSLNILVYALSIGMEFGLWAMGRADLNLKINLARLGVAVTLGLWLVKAFGPLGVAWGLLLGSLVAIVVQYSIFRKIFYSSE
jgi:O-antigen/teichoic acid export membrane protein